MSKSLFVTGTGTDVGKTYVTGLIVKKLKESGANVAYFKAAMSGNWRDLNGRLIAGDATWVKETAKLSQSIEDMCPYVYENAVSPHLAAKIENKPIRKSEILKAYEKVKTDYAYITMEGAGGICCPLSFDGEQLMQDCMVNELNLPCVIVADAGLGTINSVVLTVNHMKSMGIHIVGIVLNNFHVEEMLEVDNVMMCEAITGLNVIACVKKGDTDIDLSVETLKSFYV